MQKSYFDNNIYNAIKGIAVILLYFLHFFASSDLWLQAFYLPEFQFYEKYFQYSANLCVAIFAFLTGYGFWFSVEKTFKRFFYKSLKFLKIYWLVYFILFFVAVEIGVYSDFSFKKVFLELLGFSEDGVIGDIIAFFWYVPFYLMTLFLLYLFYYTLNRVSFFLRDFLFIIVLPVLFFSFMGNVFSLFFSLKRFFVDMILWFPCAGLGFIAAKYKIFEVMDQTISYLFKNNSDRAEVLASFIVIIVTLYGMYSSPGIILETKSSLFMPFVINMSFFYILFLTYAIKKLISFPNIKYISFLLKILGKNSLYMWLLNGVFFNVFKIYTQPILIYPHYSVLILIWGLVICFFLTNVFFVLRWLLNRWRESLNVC